jgi:hypothetical protein
LTKRKNDENVAMEMERDGGGSAPPDGEMK